MEHEESKFDVKDRRRQKQESRVEDVARLERGEISRDDLRRENSFFGALEVKNFRIAAVGRKPLS